MAAKKLAKKSTPKPAKKASDGFSDEEKSAMRERVREAASGEGDGERDLLAKIAAMREPDKAMAQRLHALIKASAPSLSPKTWYGMPAYAKDGKLICHFQPAQKFKTRYPTLGFSDKAKLDEGAMWPVAFALAEWSSAVETKIGELVKKAVT